MQGVPPQFSDEKDRARFRHLEQLPGVELYHAHISRYAFEPHTHEAFGIGVIEQGAERFRYRGSQHIAAANAIVTMNPDELHTGEAETADGWRYRMIYLEPDRLEAITGVRDWWFSEVVREDPLRSRQIGQLIYGLWHSDDPLAQQGLLLDLIDAFRPLAHHASAQGEAGHRFDRVRDYLHDNYMRPITLDELAQVAALSPYHFQRQFKAHYHDAPSDADGHPSVARQSVSHPRYARRRSGDSRRPHRPVPPDPRLHPALRHYAGALSEAGRQALMRNLIQYSCPAPFYTADQQ